MDISGERFIPASKDAVWAGLRDIEILKASIPGCETLEAHSETELKATAVVKLGPIVAKFG